MTTEFLSAAAARIYSVTASLATGLLSLRLYADFVAPDVYGVIVVALQLVGYLPMLDGGFRTAANRALLASTSREAREELIEFSQRFYSWLLLGATGVGAASLVLFGLLNHRPDGGLGLPFFVSMGAAGALLVFAGSQAGLLLGLGRQTALAIINGTAALCGVGVLAACFHAGFGVWAFPCSTLASAVLTYALAVLLLLRHDEPVSLFRFGAGAMFLATFRRLLPDAWRAFRSQVSILLLFSADLILVALFCTPAETAVYGVLSRLFGIARGFLQSFNEAAWPIVARRAPGMDRFQNWILSTNGFVYGLAAGGLGITASAFLAWYMGPEWRPAAALTVLFVARLAIMGSSTPATYFLLGIGDFRSIARLCEREVVAAVVLGALLGGFFGDLGVAAGFLAATAFGTALPFWIPYSAARGRPLGDILLTTWTRLVLGFVVGSLAAWTALHAL